MGGCGERLITVGVLGFSATLVSLLFTSNPSFAVVLLSHIGAAYIGLTPTKLQHTLGRDL